MQLLGDKERVESLKAMTGGMVSSSDLADLTKSAQAVEERSKELASKQAENLEQVSEELLCSPEIVRCVLWRHMLYVHKSGAMLDSRTCMKLLQAYILVNPSKPIRYSMLSSNWHTPVTHCCVALAIRIMHGCTAIPYSL